MDKSKQISIIYIVGIAIIITIVNTGLTIYLRPFLQVRIPYLDKIGHFMGMGFLDL